MDCGVWEIRAGDIMAKELFTLGPDASLADAAAVMAENSVSCVPVTAEGVPVGMITERDIVVQVHRGVDPAAEPLYAAMSTPALTVRENDPLSWVYAGSNRLRVRRFIVVDKDGRAIGLITRTDLLHALMRGAPVA